MYQQKLNLFYKDNECNQYVQLLYNGNDYDFHISDSKLTAETFNNTDTRNNSLISRVKLMNLSSDYNRCAIGFNSEDNNNFNINLTDNSAYIAYSSSNSILPQELELISQHSPIKNLKLICKFNNGSKKIIYNN